MTDLLFGQAYYLRFDAKMWAAQQPYPPLGALYAAAAVRARGFSVELFDAMLAASEHEWDAALDQHQPRIAVIYEDSFNYLSKMCLLRMRQAALAMVAAARARGIPVIVAGSDASDHPELYLGRGADAVVAGEGELTLPELVERMARGDRQLDTVHGLCFAGPDGSVIRTPKREFVRDLDVLPRPAWDLVDVERYRAIWLARHGHFSMHIATTRGCPYHCNWCAKPIYGQRYTVRSVECVVEEIAWLKRTYRPDHLWIADDIFGLKPGWIERFASAMVEADAVVPFKCLLRADGVTPDIARALKRAGCRTVWIGAESGSQRVLDAMEKGTRVEQIESAAALLHAAGVEVGFFLQFGYPGEGLADITLTRRMVERCRPDDIGISVSYPLPGTPFFERVKAELGDKQNWVDSDDLAMMYRGAYAPEFYRALHTLVHTEFRAMRAADAIRGGRMPTGRRLGPWLDLMRALTIPLYRHRVQRLSRQAAPAPEPVLLPVLGSRGAIPHDRPS